MVRFPGHRVIPDAERKVVARLLVGRTGFANWLGIFRYSLDTIEHLRNVAVDPDYCRGRVYLEPPKGPARRPRLENSSRLLQKNKKGGHTGHPISNREETFGRLGATFSLQQASHPLVERASAPAAPVCATRRTCLP